MLPSLGVRDKGLKRTHPAHNGEVAFQRVQLEQSHSPWFLSCSFFFFLQLLKSNLKSEGAALPLGEPSVRAGAGTSEVWTTLVKVFLLLHAFHFPSQFS